MRRPFVLVLGLALLAAACSSSGSGPAEARRHHRDDGFVRLSSMSTAPGVDRHRNLRDFWIQDVSFVDRWHGWALGYFDLPRPGLLTMQRTEDGGRTWYLVAPPTTLPGRPVTHVRFANRMDGWAFGPALYATHDGGSTWTRERLGAPVEGLESGGQDVWAVAGEHVWVAQASSDRWRRMHGAPGIDGTVLDLVRTGATRAWLLWRSGAGPDPASSRLATTRDAGRSWQRLELPCGEYDANEDLSAGGTSLWLLCGQDPGAGSQVASLYRSSDGGRSWTTIAARSNFLCCPHVYANSAAVTWVDDAYLLLVTNDGGRTWKHVLEGAGGGWGAAFTGRDSGLAWTQNQLYLTTDRGLHWRHVPIRPSSCGCIHRVGSP